MGGAQDSRMNFFILPVTAFAQNCSLVWEPDSLRAAVIDPGGDADDIMAEIAERGLRVGKILLTHGHIDHAGAAAELSQRLGVPIEGPQREEAFWLDQLPAQSDLFDFPPTAPLTPDRWLEDGDRVRVGDLVLEVIHTPGHTPGHVCYVHRPSRLAFVGDVLFAGSIGRTDFPRGDQATLLYSIRHKLFPLGDDIRFVPGHGPMSTFGDERRHNPFVADWA